MDGMTIGGGGGFELGGGYVTIAGDLTPLRDAVAEARSLTEGLVAQDWVIRPRIDLTSVRAEMAALANELQQLLGGMTLGAGASGASSINNVVNSAVSNAVSNVVNQTYNNITNNSMMGAAGTPMVSVNPNLIPDQLNLILQHLGNQGGGGGGGGSRPWWMNNLLSARGLARAVGAPVAALFAAEAIGEVAKAESQSEWIAAHPEIQVEQVGRFGSGLGLASDPTTLAEAAELNSLEARSARRTGAMALPLLGGLIRSFDIGDDSVFGMQRRREEITRDIGRRATVREMAIRAAVAGDTARGDAMGAFNTQSGFEIQQAQETLDQQLMHGDAATTSTAQQNLASIRQTAGLNRQSLAEQLFLHDMSIQGGGYNAGRMARAATLRLAATSMLTVGGAGASLAATGLEREALVTTQGVDQSRLQTQINNAVGAEKSLDRRDEIRTAGNKELEAQHQQQLASLAAFDQRVVDQRRQHEQELTTIQAAGEAARLRSMQDSFGAEMVIFEAAAQNKLAVARQTGQNLENIQALEGAIGAERAALYQGQIYAGQDVIAGAGLEISASNRTAAAAGLRMGGQGHAASMLSFQNEDDRIGRERERARRLPSLQQGIEMAKLDARQRANDAARSESEFGYRREGALMGFQLEGGAQIARDTIADMPMTARADEEVMRARMEADELILAHPERRAQIIATEQLKLDAIAHQQFGFRSGGIARSYGSLDEALLATGFGMDLGGDARDRRNAQNVLNNGRGQVGVPIPGTEPAADAMGAAAASLNDAANRLLRALTGVTLLTTGS